MTRKPWNRINTAALCLQILIASKDARLYWTKEKSGDWVITSFFIVHFNVLPSNVLSTLLSIFKNPPNVNETLHMLYGKLSPSKSKYLPECANDYPNQFLKGVVTPFVYDVLGVRLRVIKFDDGYSFVDEQYMDIVHWDRNEEIYSDGLERPIYLVSGDVVIFPVISRNHTQTLDELCEKDKELKRLMALNGGIEPNEGPYVS